MYIYKWCALFLRCASLIKLIASLYKEKHVEKLEQSLTAWLETSLSKTSVDNERNTSYTVGCGPHDDGSNWNDDINSIARPDMTESSIGEIIKGNDVSDGQGSTKNEGMKEAEVQGMYYIDQQYCWSTIHYILVGSMNCFYT